MNFNLLATVATATLFLACAQANAEDAVPGNSHGLYVSVFGGESYPENVQADIAFPSKHWTYDLDLKTGYLFGGAVGMNVTDMIRGEVELSHSTSKTNGETHLSDSGSFGAGSTRGDMSATYLLANVWMDVNNDTPFTPYVGGGAGVGWADGNAVFRSGPQGYDGVDMGFAFQLGGGVKFDLTDRIALDVGYRYKSILNVDFDEVTTGSVYKNADVNSHNVQLGLTYSF